MPQNGGFSRAGGRSGRPWRPPRTPVSRHRRSGEPVPLSIEGFMDGLRLRGGAVDGRRLRDLALVDIGNERRIRRGEN